MRVDLHSHTTLSDGRLEPEALVRLAAERGVEVLAVTDHDTSEGVPAARRSALELGLRLIPGMEVSAHHGARSLHILAFFAPAALPSLARWQAGRREARRQRLVAMLDKLDALGLPVDRAAIEAGADPRRSPGRPHVAAALVEAGHVKSSDEAFERLLGKGCPAYVDDRGPGAADAIAMIRALPGLAVVAHPVFEDLDAVLEELVALGLDGVEVFHPSHEPAVEAHFHARARELGLLISGGSDFHGQGDDPAAAAREQLGKVALPPAAWERFDEALRARTTATKDEA